MKLKIFFLCSMCLVIQGCQKSASEALRMDKATLQDRQMQTRYFETTNEQDILIATAGLLQDLGFNLDESESKLGVLVASKERDATNGGQIVLAAFVAGAGGGNMPVDKMQRIRASVVTSRTANNRVSVRVTFQRVVINTYGQVSTAEKLAEPQMYQGFFEKLSKAVFLEAHSI
jgi:hypothetical protein